MVFIGNDMYFYWLPFSHKFRTRQRMQLSNPIITGSHGAYTQVPRIEMHSHAVQHQQTFYIRGGEPAPLLTGVSLPLVNSKTEASTKPVYIWNPPMRCPPLG